MSGTLAIGDKTVLSHDTNTDVVTLANAITASTVNIKASINASGDAPIYACRAAVFAEFTDASQTAPVSNEYLNVSSIVVSSTDGHQYTVNFTTDMPHANYIAVVGSGRLWDGGQKNMSVLVQSSQQSRTASSVTFGNVYQNTNSENIHTLNVAIFC